MLHRPSDDREDSSLSRGTALEISQDRGGCVKAARVTVMVLIAAGGAAGLIASRLHRSAVDPSFTVARVKRGDVHRSVVAAGKIEPRTRVQIKSKASGLVRAVYVREGDYVSKGQLLLDLDREYLMSHWKGAKAALQVSEALEREANAEVRSARANLERSRSEASVREHELSYTETEYARKKALFSQGLISRAEIASWDKQLNQSRANVQALASGVEASEAQLRRAELGITRAKASVAQALAELEVAEEELDNASIRSPINGVVLLRRVEVGDAVSSITMQGAMAPLLMELGDTTQLSVKALVNESDIGQVRLGQPATLTIESFREQRLNGTVTRIAPLGSEKDNVTNFEVEISLPDFRSGPQLRPSMSVTAEIVLEHRRDVLLIPETALRYNNGERPMIEFPDSESPTGGRLSSVQLGISDGVHAEVRSGLGEGQEIILRR
jgi:HlyD family secretion protein